MNTITIKADNPNILSRLLKIISGMNGITIINDDEDMPNAETRQAIEEARRGEFAGTLDASSKESLMNSIMAL
ncbi:hypothetical protein HPS57_04365 [Prevotella sp. PINT]|jgi:hypothetical protein|uniref:hypothetical protein n=1 Tax=Palleniella intestinalis TaxID=2736291 RepID=UPI0015552917|nr:hypothetical protein [Palleniella intestinalis]NPD81204.1 hypothetical protein [Palleniella intestinalis]